MYVGLLLWALAGCSGGDTSSSDTQSASDTEDVYATEQWTDVGSYRASWTSDPTPIPPNELFSLTIAVFDADGAPVTSFVDVAIDAGMPEHGHGMNVTPEVTDNGDGTWTASPMKFHMTGDWTLVADLTDDTTTERVSWLIDCCEY